MHSCMKTRPKSVRNPRIRTSKTQVKTKPKKSAISKEFALPKADCHPSCLCIYSRQGNELVRKISLSESEFSDLIFLQADPSSQFHKGGDIFAQILRGKLEEIKGLRPNAIDCLDELEQAQAQSEALDHLIFAAIEHDSIPMQPFAYGIQLLMRQLRNNTASALKNLREATRV